MTRIEEKWINSVRSGQQNSLSYIIAILTKKGGEFQMDLFLQSINSVGALWTDLYFANYIGKILVVLIIAFNKNLSDEKVKCLSQMFSTDINLPKLH